MIGVMFSNISRIFFYFFSIQNIKSNCYIVFFKLFPIIFSWWKISFFPVMFIYKRFNFCYSFRMFSYLFMASSDSALKAFSLFFIDRIHCCFFIFLSNQQNLYMIHHDLDFIYDIFNVKNEHNHHLWLIPKCFDICFYNFICFIVNNYFYVITFLMRYSLFIIICGTNKVICYC